ncbi:MAG: hypothetical protein KDA91_13555 [Planctomycetaceae bacterium]|nr:hypothetical protein [Planctomycetaceae bacterium]
MNGEPQFQTSRILLTTAILLVCILAAVFVLPILRPRIAQATLSAESQAESAERLPGSAQDNVLARAENRADAAPSAKVRPDVASGSVIHPASARIVDADASSAQEAWQNSTPTAQPDSGRGSLALEEERRQQSQRFAELQERIDGLNQTVNGLRQENELTRELLSAHRELAELTMQKVQAQQFAQTPIQATAVNQPAAPAAITLNIVTGEATRVGRLENSGEQAPVRVAERTETGIASDFSPGLGDRLSETNEEPTTTDGLQEPDFLALPDLDAEELPEDASVVSTLEIQPQGKTATVYRHYAVPLAPGENTLRSVHPQVESPGRHTQVPAIPDMPVPSIPEPAIPDPTAVPHSSGSGGFEQQFPFPEQSAYPPPVPPVPESYAHSRNPKGVDMTPIDVDPNSASARNARIKQDALAKRQAAQVRFEHQYQFSSSAEPVSSASVRSDGLSATSAPPPYPMNQAPPGLLSTASLSISPGPVPDVPTIHQTTWTRQSPPESAIQKPAPVNSGQRTDSAGVAPQRFPSTSTTVPTSDQDNWLKNFNVPRLVTPEWLKGKSLNPVKAIRESRGANRVRSAIRYSTQPATVK